MGMGLQQAGNVRRDKINGETIAKLDVMNADKGDKE